MSIRRRFPNPTLTALHPGILPGGVSSILLVGEWSAEGDHLLCNLRRAFPNALLRMLTPIPSHNPEGISESWTGKLIDPEVIARARAAKFDLIVPVQPYGLMGETRPEVERFALMVGARAVAVHETSYETVRIATRSHLRYRLYARSLVCWAFAVGVLVFIVIPFYVFYMLERRIGLWESG